MGKYIGPKCRLCRREGEKLLLKGERCFTYRCSFEKKSYAPGEHGNARRMKLSNFGLQLREKQKVKRIYGIYERQFRSYFAKAASKKAVTGAILFQILERRLDNTVFQCGFATSRSQARQLIGHGFMSVNDRPVNISSYLIKQGDEISVRSDKKGNKIVKKIIEKTNERTVPAWLEVDKERLKAKVMRLPERSDVDFPANEQLIVELYSR